MEFKLSIAFGILFFLTAIVLLFILYKAKLNIKKLEYLQKEVEANNKELSIFNKQKDYILATVAHDLRGPIGNIKTITGFITQDEKLNEESKTLVQLINQSADFSLSIINDLADAINVDRKTEILNQDKIILSQIIELNIQMLQESLTKKRIKINTNFFPSLEIIGDKNLIIRLFLNLISNAIKYSNVDSEIEIETSLHDENEVMIKILDHGIGIEASQTTNIFEAFTSSSRRGTSGEKSIGLGLSICKKVVELHKGKIWVDSKQGVGSVFFVVLPINYLNKILKSIPFDI